jgi:hypothetical protein
MHDLASVEGASLDGDLAQRYFDALPERARAFLDRLEEETVANRASYEAQLQARDAHHVELTEAEARRDAFKRGMRDGVKEDVVRLAVYEKRVADARARLRAIESVAPIPSNIDPASIMSCIFKAGLKPWRELQVDPPELREGETFPDALEVVREKIEVAQNRIRQIEGAILPIEEVHEAIDQEVARMVAAGERHLDSLFMAPRATDDPEATPGLLELPNSDATQSFPFLKPELLIYCFRYQVADALKLVAQVRFGEFKQRACEVIPSAVRRQMVREVEENLLALEGQEAAILRRLDGERLALRRTDMSFQAALEIE